MMTRPPVLIALPLLFMPAPALALPQAEAVPPPPPPVSLELPAFVAPVPIIHAEPPQLPRSVRAMIEEAIKGGNSDTVATVVKLAVSTQPYYADEIKAMHRTWLDLVMRAQAARTEAETDRIRHSGILDLWTGQIELGAYRSTGNTSNFGLSGSLHLDRRGIAWQHTLDLRTDYDKVAGNVSREQSQASYQLRYTLDDGLFTYGRGQYEKDRLQGFRDRYSLSGGLGYRVIKRKDMSLALEAGPAIRHTIFLAQPVDTTWSTLASLDFDWTISNDLKLTQKASGYVGSDNSTFTSLTGIEAGMAKGLKAKLSYSFEHEAAPPLSAIKTDTISRFSLVYGF